MKKVDFTAVNTVAAYTDTAAVNVAAAVNTYKRFDVIAGKAANVAVKIDGLAKLGKAAAKHFAAAWYTLEAAAAADVAADVAAAAQALHGIAAADVAAADVAAADTAAAAVTERARYVAAVRDAATAAVNGNVSPTLAAMAAAVRGKAAVPEAAAAAVAVARAAIQTAAAADTATVDVLPVRTACEQVARRVWEKQDGVTLTSTFHVSDGLARYIIAAVRPKMRLEKGVYVLPTAIDSAAVLTHIVRCMMWDMAGRQAAAADVAAAKKAADTAAVDVAAKQAAAKKAAAKKAAAKKAAADTAAK